MSALRKSKASAGTSGGAGEGVFSGGRVTLRNEKAVRLVRSLKAVSVQILAGDGTKVLARGDDVLPTPAPGDDSSISPDGARVKRRRAGGGRREPGSDGHVPRQQDVFLTCGDPTGTMPTKCPHDRAHDNRHVGGFLSSCIEGPGVPGSGGLRARLDSTARRYPPALLNGAGLSIDAQEDALYERESMLANWGVAGYGRNDDESSGYRAVDRLFSGRRDEQVRAVLRWNGVSRVLRPVGKRSDA